MVKVKKKKTLAQKIAEKEEAAAKALEERLAREAAEREANTPQGLNNVMCFQRVICYRKYFRQIRREAEIAKAAGGK